MHLWIKLLIITVLFILITACGNQNTDKADETPAHSEANYTEEHPEAVALYKQNCISCHATDLSGKVGDQSNLQTVGARLDKEQIADTIKNGGQIMPAQKHLSDDEIELLALWLSTKK